MAARLRGRAMFEDSDYVSCPVGGEFYKCEDVNYPTFLGCCSSNPCSGQMCPETDLFPMGFGAVTTPVPDYPNHSCPYGGLWYTCAANEVTFQGCCESNPCNGKGCPDLDLRAAAVHTVEVAGGSTFTVPATVATATSTSVPTITPPATTSIPVQKESSKSNTAAIAGGAAAAGVVLAVLIAVAIYCFKRRRSTTARSQPFATPEYEQRFLGKSPIYRNDHSSLVSGTLPQYSGISSVFSSPRFPFSPAPTCDTSDAAKSDMVEPSEIMGTELTAAEFKRRTAARAPDTATNGPVELAANSSRFRDLPEELHRPLLGPVPKHKMKSPNRGGSRLRNSPGMEDLRGVVSRSPSISPCRTDDIGFNR